MAGQGGYQAPSNPAPVSGPGALSRRTDGGPAQQLRELPDAQYGEAATYRSLQQGAPLAQTPGPDQAGQGSAPASDPFAGVIPMDAPTMHPDEPVTAGAALGPGPGLPGNTQSALQPRPRLSDVIQGFAASDLTGDMGDLAAAVLQMGL